MSNKHRKCTVVRVDPFVRTTPDGNQTAEVTLECGRTTRRTLKNSWFGTPIPKFPYEGTKLRCHCRSR